MLDLALLLALRSAPADAPATAACSAATFAQQPSPASLEGILRELDQRTQARRTAAAAAWSDHAQAWLAGDASRLDALLATAPEIQEPALNFLRKNLQRESFAAVAPSVILLLGQSANPAGASELLALVAELPATVQPLAVRAALARGGAATWTDGLALASSAPGPLRQAAVQTLLLHGPASEQSRLAALLEPAEGEIGPLAETLRALAARELAPDFRLPPALYEVRDRGFLREVAAFLTAHPMDAAQKCLADGSLDPARQREERLIFLTAFETGSRAFRWKESEKRMETYLKEVPRTESTEDVAWTLFRLGSRDAKRYLLEEVESAARDNPDSWRSKLTLARRQVDVGDHSDAYRGFREVLETLSGTAFERSLSESDWVWAARAAAGSRHQKEAGQWLEASGLNAVELQKYRGQPEFEPLLDKQPFKRLFGIAD